MFRIIEDKVIMSSFIRDFIERCFPQDDSRFGDIVDRLFEEKATGSVCVKITKSEKDFLYKCYNDDMNPFVTIADRLYTRRYYQYEEYLKDRILELSELDKEVNYDLVRDEDVSDEQFEAIKKMVSRKFTILTGGPGTGKTYTLVKAVKAYREINPHAQIVLVAPTGKAAARMREALGENAESFEKPMTIHSLLKPNHDLVSFKHNVKNMLPYDWIIVDEASMVDLPLAAKFFKAIDIECKITLVGDENQLASVDVGRVFKDLCLLASDSVCRLTISRRFVEGGTINLLSKSVTSGAFDKVREILEAQNNQEGNNLFYYDISSRSRSIVSVPEFEHYLSKGYDKFRFAKTPEEAFRELKNFIVLSVIKSGMFGVEYINRTMKNKFGNSAPIPYIITKNDKTLNVNNGDIGVVMPDEPSFMYLEKEDKSIRKIRIELLPKFDYAFAITVHKSQGSEYKEVMIVIPPDCDNPSIFTRETLYTAITRAKDVIRIFASKKDIVNMCRRRVDRVSGLYKV